MTKKARFIIVGFGLAGVCLARSFELAGISFKVIDTDNKAKASLVAAGMFNPVVFRRLLKTWMADEILPFAKSFYQKLESDLSCKFYYERGYYKIIGSEEGDFWRKKACEEEVGDYISEEIFYPFNKRHLSHEHGAGRVFGAGNVQLRVLIENYREALLRKELLSFSELEHKDIIEYDNLVSVGDEKCDGVIFCEGSHVVDNPWFGNLPYKLTKGEVLSVKIPNLNLEDMVNKNIFVLPLGNDLYRIGATYEWKDLSELPSESGRRSLSERLENILKIPYEIVDHKAGIRPVLADRRPVLGFHPEHPGLGIFNGLGTKGVMLAPYFADQFTNHILSGRELNAEVNLVRFYKL